MLSVILLHCNHGQAKDASTDSNQPTAAIELLDESLLDIEINGVKIDEPFLLLHDTHGNFYARAEDIKQLRLLPPTFKSIVFKGDTYFELNGYAGLTYSFNQAKQTISITAEGKLFLPTIMPLQTTKSVAPSVSSLGGFLNYDLVATNSAGNTQGAGQFEVGLFNRWGVCTSGILTPEINASYHITRLDTTCTEDEPAKMQSWRIGDIINRPGDWGLPIRMGGIQFSTNFNTQPGFISIPVKQASGIAALPSSVDVYINNNLMSHTSVPAGPFAITNVPVVNGSGVVSMVVRDALGREQLITQPFYANGGLLAKGLDNYSYEVGFIRENFGLNSNDYGKLVAVGTQRRGFSDAFTGEAHVELQGNVNNAGVNGLYLIPQLGVINTSLATSQGSGANGSLMAIGVDRQAYPFNYGMRTQWTSGNFGQLGLGKGQVPTAHQTSVNLGYTASSLGSLGLSYLVRTQQDQADIGILAANYSKSFHEFGSLNLSAIRSTGSTSSTQLFLTWSIPLGANHSVSVMQSNAYSKTQGNTQQSMATAQKNLPVGEGYGYQLQAKDSGDVRTDFTYQNNRGTYTFDVDRAGKEVASRAGVSGGIAFVDGEAFLSRRVEGSFGLAKVPGFSNVSIYTDNQLVGKTDADGNALIPRLRPYENNKITIEAKDLPMDAQIDATRMDVLPYFRSGVVVYFPIRRSSGAVFRVMLDDGHPLPAGSTIENQEAKITFPVAYDGEVYFTGLVEHNHMTAKWKGQSCEFDVTFKPLGDGLPDLGNFICKGVSP
jgi:outer membrane usher protein